MTITFDKDKLFYTNLNNETQEIDSEDLLNFLRANVEIKDGTTIDHFMTHLKSNALGINVIFSLSLGNINFEVFLEEYDKEPTEKPSWGKDGEWKLHNARIYWSCDYLTKNTERYGPEDKGSFELYGGFDGHGEVYDSWNNNEKTWNTCGLSFSFTPLNQLKNVELKLDKNIRILKYPFEKNENGDVVYLIDDVEYEMNLFTFIDSFLWEISWFGAPDDRDEAEKSVIDSSLGVEKAIENGDYKKFTSIDDLLDELNEEDDENI